MVPPRAFLSIGLSTTLTSDSLSRRRASSFGFLTPWGATLLVPLAFVTPAEESVVLRSVGIWATPMEVICLRLVAAPLWAGLQFYAISTGLPSSVAYHPAFRCLFGSKTRFLFRCLAAPTLGIRPFWYRCKIFFFAGAEKPHYGAYPAPLTGWPAAHSAPGIHPKAGVSNGPDHCLRWSYGNTGYWVGWWVWLVHVGGPPVESPVI
jgi:hypothetical protein